MRGDATIKIPSIKVVFDVSLEKGVISIISSFHLEKKEYVYDIFALYNKCSVQKIPVSWFLFCCGRIILCRYFGRVISDFL